MQRRHLLQALGLGSAAALLAGCGFELRREPELLFQSIALVGFRPDSLMQRELRRQLLRTPVKVVEDPNKAQLVLEIARDQHEKTAVVSTAAGQVREWELKLKVDYFLRLPTGEPLLPTTELRMSRDMNYTETAALAKEQEEASLYRSMTSDAVAQIMRRLAAVRLPG